MHMVLPGRYRILAGLPLREPNTGGRETRVAHATLALLGKHSCVAGTYSFS